MNGNGFDKEKLLEILRTEFCISQEVLGVWGMEQAEAALEIYESVEDFLDRTGWRRDNPECCSEEYLTSMRICRWVDGKFLYFSEIMWKDNTREELHI